MIVGRICTRCTLDESIPNIRFDEKGVCHFCHSHDELMKHYVSDESVRAAQRESLIARIKARGKGNRYDCIVGLSGGTDSTYTLYLTKKLGLRPLAVHFDDGWNSNTAVTNIRNATSKLDVDLETFVMDWDEMRGLHRAYFKASLPDPGVPSDVAIHGALYRIAVREKVKYILGGQSFVTEGTQPRDWSYIDGTYVKSVNRRFGNQRLKYYPNATVYRIAYYVFVRGIKQVPFLNLFEYDKKKAQDILKAEVGWEYYGGHHFESIYSQFINAWYDIRKFNIDRRKVTYSGPVRAGLMSREQALEELAVAAPISEEMIEYCISKLGFTQAEFAELMAQSPRSFRDFKTSYPVLRRCRHLIKLISDWGIITPVLYKKYCS